MRLSLVSALLFTLTMASGAYAQGGGYEGAYGVQGGYDALEKIRERRLREEQQRAQIELARRALELQAAQQQPQASAPVSRRPWEGRWVIGRLGGNPLVSDSTRNPLSLTDAHSVMNKTGIFGSATSAYGILNPLATSTPKVYAADGTYLGKLSANSLDPESISNPIGPYGSTVSPTSINNPVGVYGSKVSALSPFNEFTTTAPYIVAP